MVQLLVHLDDVHDLPRLHHGGLQHLVPAGHGRAAQHAQRPGDHLDAAAVGGEPHHVDADLHVRDAHPVDAVDDLGRAPAVDVHVVLLHQVLGGEEDLLAREVGVRVLQETQLRARGRQLAHTAELGGREDELHVSHGGGNVEGGVGVLAVRHVILLVLGTTECGTLQLHKPSHANERACLLLGRLRSVHTVPRLAVGCELSEVEDLVLLDLTLLAGGVQLDLPEVQCLGRLVALPARLHHEVRRD